MDFRDTDDRADRRRESGLKSSEGRRDNPEKTSPAIVESYVKGVHFPAQKEDLVNQARDNGAPEDVLDVLDKFSDRDYKSPIDIAREVPKAER